jgi:anthranilate phosphoribosyltransferase
MEDLMGGGRKENAEILTSIMANKATEAQQNIALLNATFAIQASGKVEKLEEAKELAVNALESGKARKMLNDFIDATNDAMGTFKY